MRNNMFVKTNTMAPITSAIIAEIYIDEFAQFSTTVAIFHYNDSTCSARVLIYRFIISCLQDPRYYRTDLRHVFVFVRAVIRNKFLGSWRQRRSTVSTNSPKLSFLCQWIVIRDCQWYTIPTVNLTTTLQTIPFRS